MKKIYIAPTAYVRDINPIQMIAMTVIDDQKADSGYTPEGGGGGQNDARQQSHNLWDEQW